MRVVIDLNADVGEGCGQDDAIIPLVSSCNIACGGHAGDEATMAAALSLAVRHEVACGAHPAFPDRANFGRTEMVLSAEELEETLRTQIERLKAVAARERVPLRHLKPHGALYNMAAQAPGIAASIVKVTMQTLPQAFLYGPPRSALSEVAARAGLRFVAEGFADRTYEDDGTLRSRQLPGAMVAGEARITQALSLTLDGGAHAHTGAFVNLPVQTICLHGDSAAAAEDAGRIRAALIARGVRIEAPR